ncbi:hypothetical protein QBC47DRAFT_395276 [Echria macrotheca]|uniref:NmrA-like domain-containing protein n=1 Tax=Echria macrotheca TaxID=438768 RepID=A0AAJ0B3L2_9PEZI|nr:hypothetical protein QBC47DRAFT_395276 [Echria macrotheca]
MSPKIIVFGATGGVGSFAARQAQKLGAKVYLGLRDTSKPVQGLSATEEQEGGFERVYADLTKPETLAEAVSKTGAKRAFIYLVWQTPDNMKSSIEALKTAGIELVVFLGSASVSGDPHDANPADVISYHHAQVEISLQEVFGNDYVSVRPGFFASNTFPWKRFLPSGVLTIPHPDAEFDYITPSDIGRVCGGILAKEERPAENIIPLYGPQIIPQRQAADTLAKVLGLDIKVERMDEDKVTGYFAAAFKMPESGAKFLANTLKTREAKTDGEYEGNKHTDAVANISKYGGGEPTTFEKWVEENKEFFNA